MYTYGYSTEARGKAPDEKLPRRESARGGSAKRDGRGGEATIEDWKRSAFKFGRGGLWREMRIRQRVEEALERDGRGVEATVEDRERSAFGRGEEWRKRGGGQPAEKRE